MVQQYSHFFTLDLLRFCVQVSFLFSFHSISTLPMLVSFVQFLACIILAAFVVVILLALSSFSFSLVRFYMPLLGSLWRCNESVDPYKCCVHAKQHATPSIRCCCCSLCTRVSLRSLYSRVRHLHERALDTSLLYKL